MSCISFYSRSQFACRLADRQRVPSRRRFPCQITFFFFSLLSFWLPFPQLFPPLLLLRLALIAIAVEKFQPPELPISDYVLFYSCSCLSASGKELRECGIGVDSFYAAPIPIFSLLVASQVPKFGDPLTFWESHLFGCYPPQPSLRYPCVW